MILTSHGIEVFELNDVNEVNIYIDGADEVDVDSNLIKGGGGAHTREKIVASASNEFICIVDESKMVKTLGVFPLPVEVVRRSRSFVARELVKLGGTPELRIGFETDHGLFQIQSLILAFRQVSQVLLLQNFYSFLQPQPAMEKLQEF